MQVGRSHVDALIEAAQRLRTENESRFAEVYWNQQRLLRTLQRAITLQRKLSVQLYDPEAEA
jgi:hypothetical protein